MNIMSDGFLSYLYVDANVYYLLLQYYFTHVEGGKVVGLEWRDRET